MNNMMARFQVLPGGIIIGHIVPQTPPANETGSQLLEGKVYEVNSLSGGDLRVGQIGDALYQMPEPQVGVDRFLAHARGHHLVTKWGVDEN